MNDEYRAADFENLEPPLQAAVNAALVEPIPQDAVDRVKARAKQLAATTVSPARDSDARERRWKTSRRLIASLTAAAALLVASTVGFLLLNHSGGQVFAQMVEKVKAANSVRFTTAMSFGKRSEENGVMYLEGNRMRMEQFGGEIVTVADVDRKQGLALNVRGKLAQHVEMTAEMVQSFHNPIDQLRRTKSDDAESIGQEMLRGRRTQVYRLHKADLLFVKGKAEMLLWIDVESQLPAKIEIRDPDPKSPMKLGLDNFVWNEPLEARLFSLAIPEGFQEGVVFQTPKMPTGPKAAYADNPSFATDGVLCRDRVPAELRWGPQGRTITAVMRDPESTPPMERADNELRQWDVATGKLRWAQRIAGADSFAATPDGKVLATVVGWEVQLRNADSGKITRTWATDERLSSLEFSPDGKILAASISEWAQHGGKKWGGVQFWDVERASLVRTIKSDDWPVSFVRYAIDGKHLATATGSVKLWNAATGELARVFPGVHEADFSPDGQTIACHVASLPTDTKVGKVDLYNLRDGSLLKSLLSEKGPARSWLTSVAYSPDGRLLVATDWNGAVTLWDVASGVSKLTIADHKAGVLSAAFSPDGATLATGSEDKTLRLRKLPAELTKPATERK